MKDGGVPGRRRGGSGFFTHQDDGFGVLAGSAIGLLAVWHLKHIDVLCVEASSGEKGGGVDGRDGEGKEKRKKEKRRGGDEKRYSCQMSSRR